MLAHILDKCLGRDPQRPGRLIWSLNCTRKVSLAANPELISGLPIQMPDNHGDLVECAGCYAGAESTETPEAQDGTEPTFDDSLGDVEDDQALDGGKVEDDVYVDDPSDDQILGEERVEYDTPVKPKRPPRR